MRLQAQSLSGQGAITIALAGQPNTGKSTVFNMLTGSKQHVGNWPGKTVEQKVGTLNYDGVTYRIVDLPGTYSLTANSLEETIARDFIIEEQPDVVVVIVDAAQLERTMYLLAEMLPLPSPVIVALNMMDVAEQEGRRIDVGALEQRIGVPVVPMVAAKKQGVPELIETIHQFVHDGHGYTPSMPSVGDSDQHLLAQIQARIAAHVPAPYPEEWVALKLLEGDAAISALMQERVPAGQWRELVQMLRQNGDGALGIASARYAWIQQVTEATVERPTQDSAEMRRGKFDRIATHSFWGIPLAMVIMAGAFVAAFIVSRPIMILVISGLPALTAWIRQAFVGAPAWVSAMLADGLVPGIGMAMAFLGLMVGMFLVIGFIEDVGYMARVAFVADRFMSRIGLHGKSFLPMFNSLACNIPGVLGSRVVDSWQQRMMTLVMAPIVPCLAVWGIIGFVGALFFGSAMPLIIVVLLATLVAWLAFTGFLFKRTITKGEQGGLIMELPPYHKPNWRTIWRFTWMHTRSFITRGFTLIAAASVVIWALSYLPNGDIETSFLAVIGRFLEPVGSLMGMDWRLMVALLASMIAKEMAIATLGVLYGPPAAIGGTSLTAGILLSGKVIEHSAVAATLQSAISPASALAFIFAVFFSIPCLGTIGAISSETKSWKWTMGAVAYYLAATFLFGFLAYQVGLLIL